MPPPAITVGLMTHNYGRYIVDAINSVLEQTRDDWELIISDDASTDDTVARVAPFLADSRIRFVRQDQNLGQGGNWGFLLKQGTAPIVATLHADDLWLPNAAAIAIAAFQKNPQLDLFYGGWFRRRELFETQSSADEKIHLASNVTMSGPAHAALHIRTNPMLPSFTFLTRRVSESVAPPRQDLKMCVDVEYFFRVSLASRQVQSTADYIGIYRVQSSSASAKANRDGTTTTEVERLIEEIPRHPDVTNRLSPWLRQTLVKSLSFSGFNSGIAEILDGKIAVGTTRARRALRRSPRLLLRPKLAVYWVLLHWGRMGSAIIQKMVTPASS